jgi:cell division protein FtsW (lipid II flippase)
MKLPGKLTKLIVAAVAGVAVALLLLYRWESVFLRHALLIGVAVGALVYTSFGTADRLKRSWTRKGPRSMRPPEDPPT